jgi:ribose/xylose/arabinose/galactoside ABC-type transport system permease subunit
MRTIRHMMTNATLRPFVLLALLIAGFAILQGNGGAFFGRNTAFSVFQHFATIGLVALALGMTMLMREFDLSVAGMMGLGGCVAVLTGNHHTGLGIAAAMLVGMLGGLVQGSLAVRLGLGSIAVSLGGLLTFTGIAYVLSGNQAIPFHDMETAIAINAPLLGIMSLRTLVVFAAVIVAALVNP